MAMYVAKNKTKNHLPSRYDNLLKHISGMAQKKSTCFLLLNTNWGLMNKYMNYIYFLPF